ncbi:PAS domain S-box protein [Hymenobacter sp. ASUV-10]|uniref:histidine kinase n=1 Tax=Hymenobacter aranciens TaxID=3063996 RepID=A0ABT9BJ13_9BACT|nr:PAS domain-containing hybrid sensor histidine kinase/response regulator [Hymenobacter sp. ASUV-10]MDO7877659.1 PAS domain S-box protein [Hymenobacter sp. ASUV-10]
MDEVPLLLFSYDLQHQRLLQCNSRAVNTIGYTKEELLAMGADILPCLIHQDELKRIEHSNLDLLLAGWRSLTWACRLRHRDGSWRWMRLRVRASLTGPTGQVQQVTGSAEDITRHRAAVAELRHNRHFLRQIVDIVPNLLYVFELREMRNLYCNSRVEKLLGYTEAEIQAHGGQVLQHLLPPEEAERFRENLAEAAQLPDHESCAIEYSVYHRDGSLRWFYATHTPFERGPAGEVLTVIGVAEDVTERRETAERSRLDLERLAEQHRLFREVIDAIPHPVYLKDGNGNYLLANRAIAEMYGSTPEEMVRRGRDGLTGTPQDIERYTTQDRQVLATHQDLNVEETYTMPDGNVLWFNTLKRLFVLADGTEQVLGVDSNITELKTTQLKLQAAKEEAEQNVQAKQDFLANMSHEIRTPLHGIIGLAGVLAKTSLSSSQLDYLRLLSDSAEHLLTVLNDVLTTARLGAGKLRAEETLFTPKQLLLGCAALLRPRAREKNLRLRVEVPPLLPVLGDAHRLRQVLLNLVSNAIKFTEEGEIKIRCERQPAPADTPSEEIWLKFSVLDTGIGVAPEVADKIFEPFTQATASTDREYGGSGLGLSISKGLVELMGGKLTMQSTPGQGSEFSFVLPLTAEAGAEPEAPAEPTGAPTPTDGPALTEGGRVLLVEDNLVNSLLAETLLRNWGWQVTAAFSGAAAVELFADREFDVVLMDIQMPGMDGETAARHLREHPNAERAATPIIALTARTMPGEAERLLSTGFNGYLAKPYKEEQLLDVLRSVLSSHAAEPLPTYQTTSMPSSTLSLYDLSNVRQLVRHDEAVVRRLAWAFIETTPAILSALDDALLRRDWQALSDAAHHLKASIDGLGVESLRQVVREVESYSDTTPPNLQQATRSVSHIREVTEQVMTQLRTEFPEK